MKRLVLIGALGAGVLAGRFVAAQTAPAKPNEHAAHHPDKGAAKKQEPKAGMGMGMGNGMGHGMMGAGMQEGGMMGMCPGMLDPGAKVEVTKLAKGVTISLTSDDAKVVTRVQKMAEAMRLMHEARAQ
jgi:hypothetical protein